MNNLIDQLFSNLDTWRHLPSYQLERRADVFFSVYLPEFLREMRGLDIEIVIPEFPVRVGTIQPKIDINKSFKIDYVAKIRNANKILFIELKTDDHSRRDKQDWYLLEAKKKGMPALLRGLKKIYAATDAKSKYDHLLRALETANLIQLGGRNIFEPMDQDCDISIIYVQPHPDSENDTITFDELAEFVGKKEDHLSKRFSQSLKDWASMTAGEMSA